MLILPLIQKTIMMLSCANYIERCVNQRLPKLLKYVYNY